MAKESIMQVRIDIETKQEAEKVYKNLGTSFAEAIRIFAKQSILEHGFPFIARNYSDDNKPIKRGCLSKYAKSDLRAKEKEAFSNAMAEKHEKTTRR